MDWQLITKAQWKASKKKTIDSIPKGYERIKEANAWNLILLIIYSRPIATFHVKIDSIASRGYIDILISIQSGF